MSFYSRTDLKQYFVHRGGRIAGLRFRTCTALHRALLYVRDLSGDTLMSEDPIRNLIFEQFTTYPDQSYYLFPYT